MDLIIWLCALAHIKAYSRIDIGFFMEADG
jgi:hypothetical protein